MTSATLLARTAQVRGAYRPDLLRMLRAVLTALALVPYVLGWAAGAAVTAVVWVWSAAVVGWRDARRAGDG